MCTAATYKTDGFYFGRNLDYEMSYGETIAIAPRNFPFPLRDAADLNQHYAIIGVAFVTPDNNGSDYPLFYDGVNEKGLGMAGLNFVGNAVYHTPVEGKDNIAQFEFLPWILGQCATVDEAKALLTKINLTNISFSAELPPSDLHWMISDKDQSIVVESVEDGLKIYDNPVGVLTNNPPFDKQLLQLSSYMHLSTTDPVNTFAPNIHLPTYSRGMGSIGLPGDLSSEGRFVKATFTKLNSLSPSDEISSVNQFFHILHSVEQQRGCTNLGDNKYEITLYSDCYDSYRGICYYTTYDNHQITAIDMNKIDLEGQSLIHYPMLKTEQINYQN